MVGGGSVGDVLWGSLFSGVSFRVIPSPKANANGLQFFFPNVNGLEQYLLSVDSGFTELRGRPEAGGGDWEPVTRGD
jgi:hypothetical protein